MRYLTLEQCKRHLRVEHDEDDADIVQAADSAEETVENYIQCPLEEYERADGSLPASLIRGMLLLVGAYYDNRTAFTSFNMQADASILALLNPYIRYGYSSR